MAALKPLTPDLMAREAAIQLRSNLSSALGYADRLTSRAPAREQEHAARELLDRVVEVRWLGRVLLDLRDHEHVHFDDAIAQELRLIVGHIDIEDVRRAQDPASVASSLAQMLHRATHLQQLPDKMWGRVAYSAEELDGFQLRWSREPEVFQRLFFCLPDGGMAWYLDLDPLQQSNVFRVRTSECLPGWVAPRSQVSTLLRLRRR